MGRDLELDPRALPATAWLDYLDARRRMIQEWHAQGIDLADIAVRLELDVERIAQILGQRIDPPLPGSARAVVAALRERVAELERELHRRPSPPPATTATTDRPPTDSDFRAILRGPKG